MVRAVGRGAGRARDLDTAHRRDGLALALIALAVICAIGSWFAAAGPVGHAVDVAVRWTLGVPGLLLPVLLVVGAVVMMRSRTDGAHRARRSLGALALVLAVTGMFEVVHLVALPAPAADTGTLRMSAGGVVGVATGYPLYVGVSEVPAMILLALLALFGVLLVTGVALRDVPRLARNGYGLARGEGVSADDSPAGSADGAPAPGFDHAGYLSGDAVDLDGEVDPATVRLRRSSRRRQAGETAAAEPQPATVPDELARSTAPTVAIPNQSTVEIAVGPQPRVVKPAGSKPSAAAAPAVHAGAGTAGQPATETQLTLDRMMDGTLPTAAAEAAQARRAAQGSVRRANEEMIDRINGVLSQFNVDAAVTDFTPRSDRDPLRGGTWARREGGGDHRGSPATSPMRWPPTTCGCWPRSPASPRSASRCPTRDREMVRLGDVLAAPTRGPTSIRW